RAVHLRFACGLSYVAARSLEQRTEIVPFEAIQHSPPRVLVRAIVERDERLVALSRSETRTFAIETCARSHHERGIDHVAELTHVAGPVVAGEPHHLFGRENVCDGSVVSGFAQKMLDQEWNVFPPFAERWDFHQHDGEPVKKIEPKAAGVHFASEIAVSRAD